ncbi:hypothetical protein FHETE_7155 [Fusarium heterosporum]|uniref:Apple domain-containing protein n=1 Tax=Fusarium heterosporum TaxID=42747 RepID=A0A8H5T735_FUSHE|nr:hypothetical protein FHETE_7155 [Fusarium heterosporum]
MKSATLVTVIGALTSVAVTSPCKPSTHTSVTAILSTTTSPATTITEGTTTVGSATTDVTTTVTESSITEASTTFETSTAEPTTTTAAAASTTTPAASEPICGLEGFSTTSPYEGSEISTLQDCRDRCLADEACQAFLPNYEGYCYLYTTEVSQFVTASKNTGAFFYDIDCVFE